MACRTGWAWSPRASNEGASYLGAPPPSSLALPWLPSLKWAGPGQSVLKGQALGRDVAGHSGKSGRLREGIGLGSQDTWVLVVWLRGITSLLMPWFLFDFSVTLKEAVSCAN